MQNLIVFMEPSEDLENISVKAGKLYLNRFCIDEDSACELSGVYYLKESSREMIDYICSYMISYDYIYMSSYDYMSSYVTKKCEMILLHHLPSISI